MEESNPDCRVSTPLKATPRFQQVVAALQEGEMRFRALVLTDSPVLYRMSPDWVTIDELSERGFLASAEVPTRAWLRDYVHREDRGRVLKAISEAIRKKSVVHMEHRVRRTDGTWGWVRSSAVPMMAAEGKIVAWFGVAQDVTEVHRQHDELVALSRRKSQFLATLAHELRNPLAAIQLVVQTMNERRAHDAGDGPHWAVLERQVAQLAGVVQGVLDVARLERGTLAVHKTPTALQSILTQALDIVKPVAQQAGVRLTVAAPDIPLTVDADPVRIAQVVTNLVDNACKFSAAGGEVAIRVERSEGSARISVADGGVGMTPDTVAHIFDLFWKGSDPGEDSGLGVGLTLTRDLVEMHGGTIQAHSEGLNRGSTFTVDLPLAVGPPGDDPGAGRVPSLAPGHRVLVVDDNADLLAMLAAALDQMGLEAATTRDGREALGLMRSFRPTVVILDIGMAPWDGYKVARMIKDRPAFAGVPLVALTGWGSPEDVQRAREAGFSHHLVKPVRLDRLQELLASIPIRGGHPGDPVGQGQPEG